MIFVYTHNIQSEIQIFPNPDDARENLSVPPAILLSDGHRLLNEDVVATIGKCNGRSHVILHNCFSFSSLPPCPVLTLSWVVTMTASARFFSLSSKISHEVTALSPSSPYSCCILHI